RVRLPVGGHHAGPEIGGTLGIAGHDGVARRVYRHAHAARVHVSRAPASAPSMSAGGVERQQESVGVADRGDRASTEIDRSFTRAGDENLSGSAHRDASGVLSAGVAEALAPYVIA